MEVFWAKERRGSFWPCQVVPYAMVPEQDARKFGQVARDGITWEQYNPLLTPWQMIPFLGITPIDQDVMGSEPEQITAFNQDNYAKRRL